MSRKGKAATLRDVEVIAAAKASGLVDNKVASFDETRTSLRLVIPVALRPMATRRRAATPRTPDCYHPRIWTSSSSSSSS